MSLRLLFLTQTFPRDANDTAGPFIAELARGLVRAGDRVTVLVPHTRGLAASWQDRGVEVKSFRYAPASLEVVGYGRSLRADEKMRAGAAVAAPLYLAGARRALSRQLRRQSYDWIHAHWIVPNGLAAPLGSSLRGAKLAFGLHGSDVFLAEKPALGPWIRRALRGSSLVTGCSPELVERVRALSSGKAPAWRVIPYGVDVEVFQPEGRGREQWRSELGVDDTDVLALGVGRMATKKGFQVLLPELGPLLDQQPHLRLVLAGGGDLEPELRRHASRWPERVHILGSVARDRLPALYRAADLFVLPAIHDRKGNVDGLPNVILEAMASGLPVIASEISGIPLAVRSEQEGLLVPEGDVSRLLEAIGRLVEAPAERRRMGAAGRQRVERELTWDQVAAKYRQAYLSATAEN